MLIIVIIIRRRITIVRIGIKIIKYNKKSRLGKNNVSLKKYITRYDDHFPGFSLLQFLRNFKISAGSNERSMDLFGNLSVVPNSNLSGLRFFVAFTFK